MSGGGGASAQAPNDMMSNAGYIASLLDLHQPGSADQDSGGYGDSLETEEDWSPYPTLGVNVVVSKLRPLGRKANAVKGFVRTYVTRKVSEIMTRVKELERGGGKDKSGCADTPPPTPPPQPAVSQSPEGAPSDDYERLGELLDDGSNDARRDCGPDLAADLAEIGGGGESDEDDASAAEVRRLKSEIKDMRGRGFMAIAEIEKAALVEMVTLLETSACVPDAVKACAMWINRHEDDMALDFDVRCKDLGPFGQLITSMMTMYKDYGVPTNQWPVMVFTIGRDVGYIAHIIGRLAMHIKVMGKFAGGKSHALETMANLSVKGTTCAITGSSTQGMLPIYAEEGKPEGDMTALYDELPPLWTTALRRMSMNDQKAARMMTSLMTKVRKFCKICKISNFF